MSESSLRVVIAGGGTGGHLFPGLAIAREILARRPDAVVTFAGTARGIEARAVPAAGFELDTIRSLGLKGKSPLDHLTPGRYRLTVEAVDKAAGLSLQAEQVFFVEAPAQAAGAPEAPARPN